METKTPEYLALSEQLQCTGDMQKLAVQILRQDKMTQNFVRESLGTLIDSYFSLEEKTVTALNRCHGYSSEIAFLRLQVDGLSKALNEAVYLLESCAPKLAKR